MAEPKEKPAQPSSDGTPRAVFLRAVSERIAGDRKHGWGAADSMHVIGQLWLSENGDELPSVVAEFINDVVNPSAFRQKLEDANLLDRAPVKVKGPLAELAAMQAK